MKKIKVAMVIARDEKGKVLALKKNLEKKTNPRYEKNPWETPGGKIKDGETVIEAAKRELKEETDFSGIYFGNNNDYPSEELKISMIQEDSNGEEFELDFFPVTLYVKGIKPEAELSDEHSEYSWLTPEDFNNELPKHNVEAFRKVKDRP